MLPVLLTEHEWEQLAVLLANVTEYHLSASNGKIYAAFRISAFNQYGSSEAIEFEGLLLLVFIHYVYTCCFFYS